MCQVEFDVDATVSYYGGVPKRRDSAGRDLRGRVSKGFGLKVSAARARVEMLQQDLGRALGVSRTTVSYIECGAQGVALDQAYRIAKALNVPITDLLPAMDEAFPPATIHSAADDPLTPTEMEQARRIVDRVEEKVRLYDVGN